MTNVASVLISQPVQYNNNGGKSKFKRSEAYLI